MKAVYRPYCGGRTKRNGRTSSGSQRWRCTACGASTTLRYDDTAARLEELLGWLLSKDSQGMMLGGGWSFRRRTAEFREAWPMPVPGGELLLAVLLDGLAFEVDGADGALAGLAQKRYRPVQYAAHERVQLVLVDTLLLGGETAIVREQLLGVHRPLSVAPHELAEQYRARGDALDLDDAVVAAAAASG